MGREVAVSGFRSNIFLLVLFIVLTVFDGHMKVNLCAKVTVII